MRGFEIRFDTPARAVVMALDVLQGMHVLPYLAEGTGHGLTMRVVVPDYLGRMLRDVAAIHGGTLIRELALTDGSAEEHRERSAAVEGRRRPPASA